MGFVTEQHEEWKAKIDADSAAFDPNYVIARETGADSEAPAAAPAGQPQSGDAPPEGYEESPPPQ